MRTYYGDTSCNAKLHALWCHFNLISSGILFSLVTQKLFRNTVFCGKAECKTDEEDKEKLIWIFEICIYLSMSIYNTS